MTEKAENNVWKIITVIWCEKLYQDGYEIDNYHIQAMRDLA